MFLMVTLIGFSHNQDAIETVCSINSVYYTKNISDTINMVTCDCGYNCKSQEGTCIRIYISSKNIKNIRAVSDVNNYRDKGSCTFQEKSCKDKPRMTALEETYNTANWFISKKNNNQTIVCYEYLGNLYLENTFNNAIIIVSSVLFGLSFCCTLCCCFPLCECKKNHLNSFVV